MGDTMKINVANMLTSSRLVLTPVFIACFVMGRQGWALAIFSLAGFTDLIDGSVARFLKQPSRQGALMDPLADKFLLQSCFTALMLTGFIPLWFFLLALARDIMIVSGIIYLEREKVELPYRPTYASKFSTLNQLAVALIGLIRLWRPGVSLGDWSLAEVHFALIVITAVLIFASGAQYVKMGMGILRQHRNRAS